MSIFPSFTVPVSNLPRECLLRDLSSSLLEQAANQGSNNNILSYIGSLSQMLSSSLSVGNVSCPSSFNSTVNGTDTTVNVTTTRSAEDIRKELRLSFLKTLNSISIVGMTCAQAQQIGSALSELSKYPSEI